MPKKAPVISKDNPIHRILDAKKIKDINLTKKDLQARKPTVLSKERAYALNANLFPLAIKVLKKALKSPNENIRVSTAKQVIDKLVPDVKATEVSGMVQGDFRLNIVLGNGFKPIAIDGEVVTLNDTLKPLQDAILGTPETKGDILAHPKEKDASQPHGKEDLASST